jgi:UDP-glucose 4-epimerase
MSSVLVTGGAGFIGSHTCLTLIEHGYKIIVTDTFSNSSPEALERVKQILLAKNIDVDNMIKIFKLDIRDENSLQNVFLEAKNSGYPINSVLHFAGLKAVEESVENPILYWDVNVNGAITLLKVMESNDCKTMVFSSSATIYGMTNKKTLVEESKISPINPYGSTKVAIENLCNDIFNKNKEEWRIANLRYFNPIGAHQSGLIGESPIGQANNIFPVILDVAVGKSNLFRIFGKEWPSSDGTCVRDYIHVVDLAEGHLKTLEYLEKNKPQILNLNLGTGIGTSVLELLRSFEKTNHIEIPFEFSSPRKGDSFCIIADNTLAKKLLDWNPARTIEDACLDGWNWRTMNPNGFD